MNGFWGDKRFVKRKRKKDTKIGREPIGLTKGRKYPGRNVLKPKFGVDTEVFENAVSGNNKSGNQGKVNNIVFKFIVKIIN